MGFKLSVTRRSASFPLQPGRSRWHCRTSAISKGQDVSPWSAIDFSASRVFRICQRCANFVYIASASCGRIGFPHNSKGSGPRSTMMVLRAAAGVLAAGAAAVTISIAASAVPSDSPVAIFESGHVRPLALSPAGTWLFAVNTPDNRIEVFSVTAGGVEHAGSIPVGLEPVAVAARTDSEVWVVNHLSDSVSIVDVDAAGSGARGSNAARRRRAARHRLCRPRPDARLHHDCASRPEHPDDPQLTTPGVGRADVWVFDADSPRRAPRRHPVRRS